MMYNRSEFSETLGLGLDIQDLVCQDQVLILVLIEFQSQDQSCTKSMISLNLGHQQDSWSWSRNSRPGLSTPCIGLDFDRIFKSSFGLGLEKK